MQFYRDGFRSGDPELELPAGERAARIPESIDVLVVGSGPAGCVLGAQLAAFPDIETRIVERRVGPLELGHADGVACRTVEMFQAFGLADALLREAYWVNEVRFWGPSDTDRDRIVRTGRVVDTPDGLSEFPHVIVNQARMQQFLLERMAKSASRLSPDYGVEFVSLSVDSGDYPVIVRLRRTTADTGQGQEFTVRARYVVGCDGARSLVRESIGRELEGDSANHAWGVMDVLAQTDFPDWRTKNVVQSDGKGSLLMIPREGGNMVRCYVDLGEIDPHDNDARRATAQHLTAVANEILHPYHIDVRSVAWSSVYEVGQRLADAFDDVGGLERAVAADPRVFIAGDACHTHSAKAGQGMNVSMQDAFNLGWKLAAVLRGQSGPELLRTYSSERRAVAAELIEFDRFWSRFIAEPIVDPSHPEAGGITAAQMEEQFQRQGQYTAGLATCYEPSPLTGTDDYQHLAQGFRVGTRFHSTLAVRVADMRCTHLGHTHLADGRWRIYAFDNVQGTGLLSLANWLADDPESPVRKFTPDDRDIDAVIDVYGVFRTDPHDVNLMSLPKILLPRSGSLGLQDWEKAWAVTADADVFKTRKIGVDGATVIVRPDQYVAHVLPLSARAEVTRFFAGFLVER